MKKSIVTGGAGFIGSHLVDLLIEHNHEVVIIDNLASGNLKNIEHLKNTKSVCLIESDINNIESNNKDIQNADFVFHLAGLGDIVPSIENPTKYFYANYFGTLNLLEALKDIGPGGHFLGCEHTQNNFLDAFWRSDIFDYKPFETWSEDGAKDTVNLAKTKVNGMLKNYEKPFLEKSIEENLTEYVTKAKLEKPDSFV